MEDDCWLPGLGREPNSLMREATYSDLADGNIMALVSSAEREPDKKTAHWSGQPGTAIEIRWKSPRKVDCLRLIFDSNLNDGKVLPCRYPMGGVGLKMPSKLVKAYRIEVQSSAGGPWETIREESSNIHRRAVLPVDRTVAAVRWTGLSTWGDPLLRLFSFEALPDRIPLTQEPAPGRHWNEVVGEISSDDLKEPDHGLESKSKGPSLVGA